MIKIKNFFKLSFLYIFFILQKKTIISFLLSLSLILVVLLVLSDLNLDKYQYLKCYEDYHHEYFKNAIFAIMIFNSIFIASISISFTIDTNKFDILFITNKERNIVTTNKLLISFLLIMLFTFFEIIILYLIPLIRYDLYKINNNVFITFISLLSINYFELLILMSFTTLIPNIFINLIITFVLIIYKYLLNISKSFKDIMNLIIPSVNVNGTNIYLSSFYLMPFYIIIFSLTYYILYERMDFN